MLGSVSIRYAGVLNMEGGEQPCVLGEVGLRLAEEEKLGLPGRELDLVLLAVHQGKVEQMLKLVDVVGHAGYPDIEVPKPISWAVTSCSLL